MIYIHRYASPLGKMTMASDGQALTGLWFDGQKYFPEKLTSCAEEKDLPVFDDTDKWLDMYFRGEIPDFTPELNPAGTEFRVAVWEILRKIPYGETVTYGEIAAEIARLKGLERMSAQAVGGAVGHNPISVIIPCHRVLGASGELTGYAGGLEKKQTLLQIEKTSQRTLSGTKRKAKQK